jgi:uncharacterized protein (DUF608 family)
MNNGLRYSGIPLGGLGTGSVELQADGYFHDWQIMNNAPLASGEPFAESPDCGYFALRLVGEQNHTLMLATAPKPQGNWNNPYSQPWLIYADKIEAEAKFPFTKLKYIFDNIDIEVELEAFSPFIPHDSKNSGLPTAFFNFTLNNKSQKAVQATIFAAFRNLSSYDNPEVLSSMQVEENDSETILTMERENEESDRNSYGNMAIAVKTESKGESSWSLHPRPRDLWEPLIDTGYLDKADMGDFVGKVGNEGDKQLIHLKKGLPYGALARTVTLDPEKKKEVLFNLSWYFPSHHERDYIQKDIKGTIVGHQYNNHFESSKNVAEYAVKEYCSLSQRTRNFFDAYYKSSMPEWLLEAASSQFAILIKSSWWDEKGRFIIWEGLGCCGMQTTDITYYGSFPILQLFPDIQKSQMRCTLNTVEKPGKIPHMLPANFQCCDVDHRQRKDLIPQFILLIWRDYLWTGDKAYLEEMWQTIKDGLDYFKSYDSDGDGLPNNTGPDQTYDQLPLIGTSAFLGYLYTASLIAAADMSAVMGEMDYKKELEEALNDALPKLDRQLWNGEYFDLSYDSENDFLNKGVMADQINGDWFLRQSVGKGMLPDDKVRSSLKSIAKYCHKPEGYLANCAWPEGDGTFIDRRTADQANWPWTGVEYTVASHLIITGMVDEGIAVAKDVWDRYEKRGMRFNHIECGGFYYRALSSWCVYLSMTGFSANLPEETIEFNIPNNDSTFIYALPDGWGIVNIKENKLELEQKSGKISFSKLKLKGIEEFNATCNGTDLKVENNIICFDKPIILDSLTNDNIIILEITL